MQAGNFNLNDYLSKLNESSEETKDGGVKDSGMGIMIPDGESKKAYDWLKKEYDKGKTEVKVEMRMGGQKVEPEMKLQQAGNDSVKNFKSGIFGEIKTSDTEGSKKTDSNKSEFKTTENSDNSKEKDTEEKDSNESSEQKQMSNKKSSKATTAKIDAKVNNKKKEKNKEE